MSTTSAHLVRIQIMPLGKSLGLFLGVTYALCVVFDLVVPQMAMHKAWQVFLPGFHWLSFPSFLLGLIESIAYGWYVALVWGSLHNYFLNKSQA